MTKSRLNKFLENRKKQPGTLYKLAGMAGAGLDVIGEPLTDESEMSATAVIVTPTVDREGDIIVPDGGRLENYAKNPVVLWDHGLDFKLPLGISEGPDKQLALHVSPDEMVAKCYFSQSLLEAAQIFELITEGVMRGTSVQANPLAAPKRKGGALVWDDWEMIEWSWTVIGVNADALRRTFDTNSLAGKAIAESLRKSFLPYVPKRPAIGIGLDKSFTAGSSRLVDQPEEADMPTAKELAGVLESASAEEKSALVKALGIEPPSLTKSALLKMVGEMDDDEKKSLRKQLGEEEQVAEPVEPEEEEVLDKTDMPFGAEIIKATLGALESLGSNLDAAMPVLEQPNVKTAVSMLREELGGKCNDLKNLYSGEYPDKDPLVKMEGEEEEEPVESDEERLEKFLRADRYQRLLTKGLAVRVRNLGSAKNLTKSQRNHFASIAGDIERIVQRASQEEAADPALVKEVEELKARLARA